MIGKLDTIIYKINNDKRFLLSVYDLHRNVSLYRFFPATNILEKFGSAENFFEELHNKGHKHLSLGSYAQNGTGKKKIAEHVEVNFGEPTQEDNQPDTPETEEAETITEPAKPNLAMNVNNDVLSSFGLGVPQVMELMVKKHEADRLKLENSELRLDNRSLKEQNEKYKEELLKDKYDYQKEKEKKGDTHALIGQIATSIPAIMQYIKPNPSEGLHAPVDYGSSVKNSFAQTLKQIDDDTLMILVSIAGAINTNTHFSNELIQLLKKYQLWQ